MQQKGLLKDEELGVVPDVYSKYVLENSEEFTVEQ